MILIQFRKKDLSKGPFFCFGFFIPLNIWKNVVNKFDWEKEEDGFCAFLKNNQFTEEELKLLNDAGLEFEFEPDKYLYQSTIDPFRFWEDDYAFVNDLELVKFKTYKEATDFMEEQKKWYYKEIKKYKRWFFKDVIFYRLSYNHNIFLAYYYKKGLLKITDKKNKIDYGFFKAETGIKYDENKRYKSLSYEEYNTSEKAFERVIAVKKKNTDTTLYKIQITSTDFNFIAHKLEQKEKDYGLLGSYKINEEIGNMFIQFSGMLNLDFKFDKHDYYFETVLAKDYHYTEEDLENDIDNLKIITEEERLEQFFQNEELFGNKNQNLFTKTINKIRDWIDFG